MRRLVTSHRGCSLLLLAACQEYELGSGKDDPSTISDSATPTEPSTETEAVCGSLDLPETEALSDTPTCESFSSDWDLVVEIDVPVGGLVNAAGLGPFLPGEPPGLLVCVPDAGTNLLRVAAVDPWDGSQRTTQGIDGTDCASFAWAATSTGEAIGAVDWAPEGVAVTSDPDEPWILATTYPVEGLPVLADLDADGIGEILYENAAIHSDGTRVATYGATSGHSRNYAADVVPGGTLEVVAPDGVYDAGGGQLVAWTDLFNAGGGFSEGLVPVRVDGLVQYLGTNTAAAWRLGEDGSMVWRREWDNGLDSGVGGQWAVGDADGDGRPDMCFFADDRVVVLDFDGEILLDEVVLDTTHWSSAGCAMADLDADGADEVVTYDASGLRVFDVPTQTLLAARPDLCSNTWQTPPAIADVDGDGSAEILVVGQYAPCPEDQIDGGHIFVVGPSEGRWSRTRPVWNQLPYDPALIDDHGVLERFPAWSNRFRSQPARDGERSDLAPEVVDACAEDCESGTIALSVRVRNTGAVEASAGAEVAVLTWTAADGLREVATGRIPEAIPAGWASAAIRLDVPAGDWGDARVIEVRGDPTAECDTTNDRLATDIPDPCPGS